MTKGGTMIYLRVATSEQLSEENNKKNEVEEKKKTHDKG